MARVAICTPSYDGTEKLRTGVGIYNMDRAGHDTFRVSKSGYGVEKGRDECVKEALVKGAEWVFFVDSDIEVPEDALDNLMSHGVDVCLGWYCKQNSFEGKTCLYVDGQPNLSICHTADELKGMASEGRHLIEVKGGGMGCALVKADVFDRVKFPWFNYIVYEDGRRLSEDLSFCLACRGYGMKVHADTRVGCAHAFRYWKEP